jgi:uncharacterized membrane protein
MKKIVVMLAAAVTIVISTTAASLAMTRAEYFEKCYGLSDKRYGSAKR